MPALGFRMESNRQSLPSLVPIFARSGPTFFLPAVPWHPEHLGPVSAENTLRPRSAFPSRQTSSWIGGSRFLLLLVNAGRIFSARLRTSGKRLEWTTVVATFFSSTGNV